MLAKGNYFSYAGKPAFTRLIYPAPVPGGLGVHVTLDLAGLVAGSGSTLNGSTITTTPSIRAAARPSTNRSAVTGSALPDSWLVADYAGIRPKLTGPGEPAADFMVDTPAEHGLKRLVHLFGIESAGPHRLAVARRAGGGEPR